MKFPENRYQFSNRREKKKVGKRWILVVVILVILLGGTGTFLMIRFSGSGGGEKRSEIELIYEYWQAKKYDSVIELCNKVRVEEPLQPRTLVLAGFAYFYKSLGEYSMEDKLALVDNSIFTLRKARIIENRPYKAEIEYILGKAYYQKGKFYLDQAIEHIKHSIDLGYVAEDSYEYLGLAYSEIDQYEESVTYFLKALEKQETALLHLTLAQAFYRLNDKTSAEEHLLRAINRAGEPAIENKSRFLLAQIYTDRNAYLKAEKQYMKILDDNPQSADAHYYLGEIYAKMDDSIKARAEWRKALQIDPSHYGARFRYYK